MSKAPKRGLTRFRQPLLIVSLSLGLGVYSVMVADFITRGTASVEVTTAFIAGWVTLVGVLSLIEASLVSRLVVRGGWRGRQEIREVRSESLRPWRDMHLPLSIAIVALLGLNMLVFDRLAGGFFVDEQKATYAITRMRSDDVVMQREGIFTAVTMQDRRTREELVRLVQRQDRPRALAAWALGKVGTQHETVALMGLLREGDRNEKAAAAVALGRLGHEQLTDEVASRLTGPDEPVEAFLVGLGLLGDRHATFPVVEMMVADATAPDHLALGAWVLGRLADTRACPLLGDLVGPDANPLTCAATYSIRRLACEDATSTLIQAFMGASRSDRCDERRFVDTDGRSFLLWPSKLYRVALLESLRSSDDPETGRWLQELAEDGTQVPQVRDLVTIILESRARRAAGDDTESEEFGAETTVP